jgi:hypothetical protein
MDDDIGLAAQISKAFLSVTVNCYHDSLWAVWPSAIERISVVGNFDPGTTIDDWTGMASVLFLGEI